MKFHFPFNTYALLAATFILTHPIASMAQCEYTIGDLVWSDEFDYSGLPDPDKWDYDVGGSGWGNNEAQYYTANRTENAQVENGNLIIEARNESYEGSNYTSARLVTRDKGDWLYGRIEVKAKVPLERGTWPAIWMLPTDWAYGGWPASGEIDIMEGMTAWGVHRDESHSTIHTEAYNHMNGTQRGETITGLSDMQENFHVYAVDWYPDYMAFSVDNNYLFTFYNEGNWEAWPFDRRFHLILNVAIGGSLGGWIDDTKFNHQMVVDYVRVYEITSTDQSSSPYNSNIATLPGIIEAEHYDEGCNTYSDNDGGNNGSGPRPDDVDMEETSDEGGGYNVGWTNSGEWMKYTISVQETGMYNLSARVASDAGGGEFNLELNNEMLTGNIFAPATGGWQSWQDVDLGTYELTKGTHELVFNINEGGFNINYFKAELSTSRKEIVLNQQARITPNPTNGIVQLSDGELIDQYSVYGLTGQVLRKESFDNPVQRIDLSDLPTGSFLIEVNSGQSISKQRVVKY